MKAKLSLIVFSAILLTLAACKKNSGGGNPPPSGNTKLVRILQGTDHNLANDTVWILAYNNANAIASIADSINKDTIQASYDNSGRLMSLNVTHGDGATYTYDASGNLTLLDYTVAGSHEQFVYEYTNGVLSKKSYYTTLGGGNFGLYKYFTYTFTGGNITGIKAYASNGTLQATSVCTYDNRPNTFKALSLFNFSGMLGTDRVVNPDTWFNTNNLTGVTVNGAWVVASNFTFNASQQPTGIVCTDNLYGVFTWAFGYK